MTAVGREDAKPCGEYNLKEYRHIISFVVVYRGGLSEERPCVRVQGSRSAPWPFPPSPWRQRRKQPTHPVPVEREASTTADQASSSARTEARAPRRRRAPRRAEAHPREPSIERRRSSGAAKRSPEPWNTADSEEEPRRRASILHRRVCASRASPWAPRDDADPTPPPQPRLSSRKKSLPLSSVTMKAGKSSTSMRQIASMPSSGYSITSTLRMQSCARRAAGPPIEPR